MFHTRHTASRTALIAVLAAYAAALPASAQEALSGLPNFSWAAPAGPAYSLSGGAGTLGVAERARPEYDAQGIRTGSFVLYPSLMSSVLYDDNVYARSKTNPNKVGDLSYGLKPGFFLKSDWTQHSFNSYGSAEFVGYKDFSTLNHTNGNVGFDTVIDVSRDMKWSFGAKYEHQIEPFGIGESVGNFDKLVALDRVYGYTSYTTKFNRMRVGLLGSVKDDSYTDGEKLGVKQDQSYRNNTQYLGTLRVGYETAPGAVLFAEGGADRRDFKTSIFTSTGYRAVAGVEANFTKLIKGEIYGGYGHRDYTNASLNDVNYVNYGGSLAWYVTPLATVTLLAGRDVQETLLSGTPGTYVSSTVGGRLDYEVLRNLILSGRLGYERHDYNQVVRHEDLVRSGVGATYLVNRNFSVGLDFSHIDYVSTVAGTDYARNQYGLTLKSKF
jgi:hypothetical protein